LLHAVKLSNDKFQFFKNEGMKLDFTPIKKFNAPNKGVLGFWGFGV